MGWTFQNRQKGIKERDFWQDAFGDRYEVVDVSKVSGTVYVAAKNKETGLTSAAVILTRWVPNDYYNFGYKDMDESMGVWETKAPDRIIDQLSSVEDLYGAGTDSAKYAAEWREACRAYNAKAKVTAGTKVRFVNPGSEGLRADLIGRTFERLAGRSAVFSDGYTRYRIPFYRDLNYEVVA